MSNELERTNLKKLKAYFTRLSAFGLAAASFGTAGCSCKNNKNVVLDVPPSIEITNTPDIAELTTFTADPISTPTVAPTNTPEPTSTPAPTEDPLIDINWEAIEQLEKFGIERLVAIQYLSNKDFNPYYIADYENARTIFNTTTDKAIDYVNRAYKISETNFFEGATIQEIASVVEMIDMKRVARDNNYLDNILNTSFNSIVENYFFGNLSEKDNKKIEALKLLAKDNSDMDKFLTQLATLTQKVLKDTKNEKNKSDLANHIIIFGRGVNGFNNHPEFDTNDKEFNENARVDDFFDYYIAYQSFVKPIIPLAQSDDLMYVDIAKVEALMGTAMQYDTREERINALRELLNKNGYGKYIDAIIRYAELYWEQLYIETALLGPEFTEICVGKGYVVTMSPAPTNGGGN